MRFGGWFLVISGGFGVSRMALDGLNFQATAYSRRFFTQREVVEVHT